MSNIPSPTTVRENAGIPHPKKWEPAVLPLSAVHLNPPLPAMALKPMKPIAKGDHVLIGNVLATGMVTIIGRPGFYPMSSFVELLAPSRKPGELPFTNLPDLAMTDQDWEALSDAAKAETPKTK